MGCSAGITGLCSVGMGRWRMIVLIEGTMQRNKGLGITEQLVSATGPGDWDFARYS
jgi:hypothetical protein